MPNGGYSMKSIWVIVFASLFFSHATIAANNNQWHYIGLSGLIIDSNHQSGTTEGFVLDSRYELNDTFYLRGTYQNYNALNTDNNRSFAGAGGRYHIDPRYSLFAQIDYVYLDSDAGFTSISTKYWIYNLGLYGKHNEFSYKLGLNRYDAISNNLREDTGVFAELFYDLTDKVTIGLELESVNNSELYSLGARYHF